MKSVKNMPESLETMTDSVWLRPVAKIFYHWGDVLICVLSKHKRAFSLVEKCRVTSWPCR